MIYNWRISITLFSNDVTVQKSSYSFTFSGSIFCKLLYSKRTKINIETTRSTRDYLGGQICPHRVAFVLDSDWLHSWQNHVLGYFHSKPTHACDQDARCAHPVHGVMPQNIPGHTWDKQICRSTVCAVVKTPLHRLHYRQKGYLQLSGVEAFIYFYRHPVLRF